MTKVAQNFYFFGNFFQNFKESTNFYFIILFHILAKFHPKNC
jgi:hypothetical protein